MATYTMELKNYIEMFSYENPMLSHREKIEIGRVQLFNFTYPIFDESYRKIFETHFIRHFYFREIGFETEELFKFHLETWLNIHMPYFNELFSSTKIEYNPLYNTSMKTTYNKNNERKQQDVLTGESTSQGTNTGNATENTTSNQNKNKTDDQFNREIDSNNPDSRLQLSSNDGSGVIEYASNITENKKKSQSQDTASGSSQTNVSNTGANNQTSNVSNDLNSNINTLEDYIENREGKIGIQSYPSLIKHYRENFLRIEQEIFKEMACLFMMIY